MGNRIITNSKLKFLNKNKELENLRTRLSLLDPKEILKRGYTITSINNKLISKVGKVSKGDKIKTITDKLTIDSIVENSVSHNDKS